MDAIIDRTVVINMRQDDIEHNSARSSFSINQGNVDSVQITFKIFDGAAEIDYTKYTSAQLTLSANGNTFLYSPVVLEGADMYYTIEPSALIRTGTIKGELQLTEDDGTTVATPHFIFLVIPSLTKLQSDQERYYINKIAALEAMLEADIDIAGSVSKMMDELRDEYDHLQGVIAEGDYKGEPGFSPEITEAAGNTDADYRLNITTAESSFSTPNLKGQDGGGLQAEADPLYTADKPFIAFRADMTAAVSGLASEGYVDAAKEAVTAETDTKLTAYLTEEQTYDAIAEAGTGLWKDMGSVPTRAELPAAASDFWIYTILDEGDVDGDGNHEGLSVYARNQSGTLVWHTLNFTVNLANYETTVGASEKMTAAVESANAYTDAAAEGKVDKIPGKGLSSNDYTDADKSELAAAYSPTNKPKAADLLDVPGNDNKVYGIKNGEFIEVTAGGGSGIPPGNCTDISVSVGSHSLTVYFK
ncbi:MAG: hypothetical protein LBS19_16840, partial [Clostridiales bacterium]|nr:hypothetical protein [Clostridiales bacterium]